MERAVRVAYCGCLFEGASGAAAQGERVVGSGGVGGGGGWSRW